MRNRLKAGYLKKNLPTKNIHFIEKKLALSAKWTINYFSKFHTMSSTSNIIKRFSLLFFTFVLGLLHLQGQEMKGQWIGGFNSSDNRYGAKTDYILELETSGKKITGYSYTYFSMSGKRYYVICKLEGTYDKSSKSLEVNEIETVKTNTPKDFKNCHQSHQLTYLKQKDKEILIGKWKPTEVGGDCGKGETELERKLIVKIPVKKNDGENSNKLTTKTGESNKSTNPPQQKATPVLPDNQTQKTDQPKITESPSRNLQNEKISNKDLGKVDTRPIAKEELNSSKKITNKEREKLTERTRQFIKTIDVSGPSFRVEIYDNGQVDGDTVTIFLNEKLLVPAKKLTTSPIVLDIKVEPDEDVYDLIMYAESMGTIPPNTALMVVTTSTNRYEINITSTEQTSGAVRFRIKR